MYPWNAFKLLLLLDQIPPIRPLKLDDDVSAQADVQLEVKITALLILIDKLFPKVIETHNNAHVPYYKLPDGIVFPELDGLSVLPPALMYAVTLFPVSLYITRQSLLSARLRIIPNVDMVFIHVIADQLVGKRNAVPC